MTPGTPKSGQESQSTSHLSENEREAINKLCHGAFEAWNEGGRTVEPFDLLLLLNGGVAKLLREIRDASPPPKGAA